MSQKYTSTKTIWSVELEAARRTSTSYTPTDYSTLNEYWEIESGVTPADGDFPEVEYMVIGRGGHENVTSGTGDSLVNVLEHRVNNAALFEAIPFIMRETDNDLSSDERENYRFRKLETYDGTDYFVYYGKKIELDSTTPTIQTMVIDDDGEVTTTDYTPTTDQLSPTAVSMENGIINRSTDTYLTASTPFTLDLDSDEITEILAAVEIIYGDSRYAVISEIGIVSGVDETINSTDGDIDATYDECISAQIYNYIASNINLLYQSQSLTWNLRLGSYVPYLE